MGGAGWVPQTLECMRVGVEKWTKVWTVRGGVSFFPNFTYFFKHTDTQAIKTVVLLHKMITP